MRCLALIDQRVQRVDFADRRRAGVDEHHRAALIPDQVEPLVSHALRAFLLEPGFHFVRELAAAQQNALLPVRNEQQLPKVLAGIEPGPLRQLLDLRKLPAGEILLVDGSLLQRFESRPHHQNRVARNQRLKRRIGLHPYGSRPAAARQGERGNQQNSHEIKRRRARLEFTTVFRGHSSLV